MTSRVIYAVFILLLGPLILADAYGVASIATNAVVVGAAAVLVLSVSVSANTGLSPWIKRRIPRGQTSSHGPIQRMEGNVNGAVAGYFFSRQQVANLLATAYAVKSQGLMRPSYSSIQDTREMLRAVAGKDADLQEVFDDYRGPQLHRPRLLGRKARESDYLSGLESAIRLVRENE